MAQGQFTKEEAEATRTAVEEMYKGVAKGKRLDFIGHLNDVQLFLRAAQNAAPSEAQLAAQLAAGPFHLALELLALMHEAGLEPHEKLADGTLTPIPYETLRIVAQPTRTITYVQVRGERPSEIIAELGFADVVWKVPA